MRMAFGLIGLLVTVGVIVWIMAAVELPHTQAVIGAQKQVKPAVQEITGHDENGMDARDSIKLDTETSGGKITSVLVTSITPAGAMEKHFGLKRNDSIVEIGGQGGVMTQVKEYSSSDEAKDALLTAYQYSSPIVVVRDEKRITLPPAGSAPSPVERLQSIKIPTH
jgi:hypothetical protein